LEKLFFFGCKLCEPILCVALERTPPCQFLLQGLFFLDALSASGCEGALRRRLCLIRLRRRCSLRFARFGGDFRLCRDCLCLTHLNRPFRFCHGRFLLSLPGTSALRSFYFVTVPLTGPAGFGISAIGARVIGPLNVKSSAASSASTVCNPRENLK